MFANSKLKRTGLLYIAVLLGAFLLTGLIYFPAHSAWFMLEDYLWLEKVAPGKLLAFFNSSWGFCNLYRPLMRVSFYCDLNFFGENPLGWHLHSWLLHAANSAWLLLILRRLTAQWVLPIVATLLFITAPVGCENLTWISGRTGLLCAFFYLAAFYGVVLFCRNPLRRRWLLLSAAMFLAAMATYEAAFSFPAVVALFLFAPRRQLPLPRWQRLYLLAFFTGELLLALIVRYFILGRSIGQVNMMHTNFLLGLLKNIRSILDVAALHFPEQFFFSLPLVFAAFLLAHRRCWLELGQGLVLVLATVALYLPFSGTVGLPLRFLYMAQMPYWILLAGAWVLIGGTWPRWRKIILLMLALPLACHAIRCFYHADQYYSAAALAKSIPEQVKALYPAQPAGMNYIFLNIPCRLGPIPIFSVGFDAAIRHAYGNFDGKVLQSDELLSIPDRTELPAIYFYYRESDRRVLEISLTEWQQIIP